MTAASLMVYAIIVVSLFVAAFAWLNFLRTRWWVYLAFALTWAAWFCLSVFVAVADPANYNSAWFAATFIRPLNLISFALVAGVMLFRYRNDHR